MIEIPEPPDRRACASCTSVLSWLWSAKTRAWICVIPIDEVTFRLHGCRHAQAAQTWRLTRRPDPPSAAYLAAKAALAKGQERTERDDAYGQGRDDEAGGLPMRYPIPEAS